MLGGPVGPGSSIVSSTLSGPYQDSAQGSASSVLGPGMVQHESVSQGKFVIDVPIDRSGITLFSN